MKQLKCYKPVFSILKELSLLLFLIQQRLHCDEWIHCIMPHGQLSTLDVFSSSIGVSHASTALTACEGATEPVLVPPLQVIQDDLGQDILCLSEEEIDVDKIDDVQEAEYTESSRASDAFEHRNEDQAGD